MCKKHLLESSNKEKIKRDRRKNKHLCVRCGKNEPNQNKTICEICLDNNRDQNNKRKMDLYYERKSSSLCIRCGANSFQYAVYCSKCLEYMRQKDKDRYNRLKKIRHAFLAARMNL